MDHCTQGAGTVYCLQCILSECTQRPMASPSVVKNQTSPVRPRRQSQRHKPSGGYGTVPRHLMPHNLLEIPSHEPHTPRCPRRHPRPHPPTVPAHLTRNPPFLEVLGCLLRHEHVRSANQHGTPVLVNSLHLLQHGRVRSHPVPEDNVRVVPSGDRQCRRYLRVRFRRRSGQASSHLHINHRDDRPSRRVSSGPGNIRVDGGCLAPTPPSCGTHAGTIYCHDPSTRGPREQPPRTGPIPRLPRARKGDAEMLTLGCRPCCNGNSALTWITWRL